MKPTWTASLPPGRASLQVAAHAPLQRETTANHHFRFRAFAHDHLLVTTLPDRLDVVHFARVTGGPGTGYSVPEVASDVSPCVRLFLSDAHARTRTLSDI